MVTHLHNFFPWSPADNGGDQMIVLLECLVKNYAIVLRDKFKKEVSDLSDQLTKTVSFLNWSLSTNA